MKQFLIRENFYKSVRFIDEPAVRLAVYDSLFDVGFTEECHLDEFPITEREKALARLPLRHLLMSVRESNEKYKFCVEQGRIGGLIGGKLGGRGHKKEMAEPN